MCIDVEKRQLPTGRARERASGLLRRRQCHGEGRKKTKTSSPLNHQEALTSPSLAARTQNPPTPPPGAPQPVQWWMLKNPEQKKPRDAAKPSDQVRS